MNLEKLKSITKDVIEWMRDEKFDPHQKIVIDIFSTKIIREEYFVNKEEK